MILGGIHLTLFLEQVCHCHATLLGLLGQLCLSPLPISPSLGPSAHTTSTSFLRDYELRFSSLQGKLFVD